MFDLVLFIFILGGIFALVIYVISSFDGPTYVEQRHSEIEEAVKAEREGCDDIAVTVTLGWCVFVRDVDGRGLEQWVDDRPHQASQEIAARAVRGFARPVARAPPAPAPATSWGTGEESETGKPRGSSG